MDWLGKAIGLPEEFLHSKPESPGGGVIQTTASESTFVCLLAGRTEAIKRYQKLCEFLQKHSGSFRTSDFSGQTPPVAVNQPAPVAGSTWLAVLRYAEQAWSRFA